MEDNPSEAVRTNIVGTYYIAKACDEYQVEKMVLVSSDKAVRPTNVMGATKALRRNYSIFSRRSRQAIQQFVLEMY